MKPTTWRRPGREANSVANARGPDARGKRAFTLIEIVITISVMVLVAAIAMPSILSILHAGEDGQAYNLLAAQLKLARSIAIENQTYAGVHVQMAADTTDYDGVCFATIMILDSGSGKFVPAEGTGPRRMPGNIAFGDLDGVLTGSPYGSINDLSDFTTFTVVFSPAGQAVKQVKGGDVVLDTSHPIFSSGDKNVKLWSASLAGDELAATAVTVFDYRKVEPRTPAERATYLNANGQLLPVNVFTGQLLPRE